MLKFEYLESHRLPLDMQRLEAIGGATNPKDRYLYELGAVKRGSEATAQAEYARMLNPVEKREAQLRADQSRVKHAATNVKTFRDLCNALASVSMKVVNANRDMRNLAARKIMAQAAYDYWLCKSAEITMEGLIKQNKDGIAIMASERENYAEEQREGRLQKGKELSTSQSKLALESWFGQKVESLKPAMTAERISRVVAVKVQRANAEGMHVGYSEAMQYATKKEKRRPRQHVYSLKARTTERSRKKKLKEERKALRLARLIAMRRVAVLDIRNVIRMGMQRGSQRDKRLG
ncbi:hypothetical protein T440DRAFT_503592 [Plenodomus tracheiphilus IPT5]|uniref:Uncharacterized protein n=1 Tax=Plenodomus tracheiphilus IPT5 TaxID=1408161 RepID=A0A6A7BNG3_9PLEO|nr:hypothetical protein T440DRAFT_503592 [Plenodomus tracheiphilus IPT5]